MKHARPHGSSMLAGSLIASALVAFVTLTSFSFQAEPHLGALTLVVPTIRFGLEAERFAGVTTDTVAADAAPTVADVLTGAGIDAPLARRLGRLAHQRTVLTPLTGRAFATFRNDDGELLYLALTVNDHEYLRFEPAAKRVTAHDLDDVQVEYQAAAIYYDGDLEETLARAELPAELNERVRRGLGRELPLDAALQHGIVQLIYTVALSDAGEVRGYGKLEAVRYHVNGEQRDAIRFTDDALDVEGFFRPDGSPARTTFLLNPAPGSWVSSSFNLHRKHPVLGYVKAHYGTDYAAAYGTPIIAVSDGIVVAREQNRTNGNYVKIRHDATYQSQYLHMKGFARGVRVGKAVKKGQVIGYVGSTGLSSGPHVCFRFWRNGHQVNHLKEDLPTGELLSDEALAAFATKQATLTGFLDRGV